MYRASAKVLGPLAAAMAGGFAVLLVRAAGGFSGQVLLWIGLGVGAVFGFLLAIVVRAVTIVSGEGMTVRQLFGTRHYSWAEIVDIQIVEMTGTGALSAALYDAQLRQVFLPQITDRTLGPQRLEHEVARLRRCWGRKGARGRGQSS